MKAASVVRAALCTHCVSVAVNCVIGLTINHTAIYHSQLITHTSVTTVQYDAPTDTQWRVALGDAVFAVFSRATDQFLTLFRVW